MIYETLEPLLDVYDSFLIDVYGVLYDGATLYNGVPDLLHKIMRSGKKVIILSNTTLVSQVCRERYYKKGLMSGIHYNEFLSSGEIFRATMNGYLDGFSSYIQIFNKNHEIFNESRLHEASSIKEADFVYVGSMDSAGARIHPVDDLRDKSGNPINIEDILSTNCADISGFEEIANVLDECLHFRKPLVIVNPDIFAIESVGGIRRPILCQGAVGEFYEVMGGEVIYFGKPYEVVYDYAKLHLAGYERTVMVGDTPWTDILGGNMAGIDTVLTLTGVFNKFADEAKVDIPLSEKIEHVLTSISKKMTHRSLMDLSQRPTHVIRRFS